MQRSDIPNYLSPIELFKRERMDPDNTRLTPTARLEICRASVTAMCKLHNENKIPDCLVLYGLLIKNNGSLIVEFGGHHLPFNYEAILTASGYTFSDLFITSTDKTITNESSVQLLGLLFFKLFEPLFYAEHKKQFLSLDRASHDALLHLFTLMINADPGMRPSLAYINAQLSNILKNHKIILVTPTPLSMRVLEHNHYREQEAEFFRDPEAFLAKSLLIETSIELGSLAVEMATLADEINTAASAASVTSPAETPAKASGYGLFAQNEESPLVIQSSDDLTASNQINVDDLETRTSNKKSV